MKTLKQIQAEIETLTAQAEELRKKEVAGVISRIKEAIKAYDLTAADLGYGGGAKAVKAAPKTGAKRVAKAKYADGNGNTWGGMGKRPNWLREALASGKQLGDFAQ